MDTAGEIAELRARLDVFEARDAVLATIRDYSQAIDLGAEAAWVDTFLPEGIFRIGSVVPDYPERVVAGAAELRDFIAAHTGPPRAHHKHLYLLPEATIEADEATVVGYFVHLVDRGGMPVMLSFGRYLDRLRRSADGRWRFAERYAEVQASEDGGRDSMPTDASG